MVKLRQIVNEEKGKSLEKMCRFLQELTDKNEIKIFSLDKHKDELHTLEVGKPYFVESYEDNIFVLELGNYGGGCCTENGQMIYNYCTLEKVIDVPPDNLRRCQYTGKTLVPEDLVSARLKVNHDQLWEKVGFEDSSSEQPTETRSRTTVYDNNDLSKLDPLFKKVLEYVRE